MSSTVFHQDVEFFLIFLTDALVMWWNCYDKNQQERYVFTGLIIEEICENKKKLRVIIRQISREIREILKSEIF